MKEWLRGLFLNDWRNKIVALFFAVSIWFVAYQHETDSYTAACSLEVLPADPDAMVVIGTQVKESGEEPRAFSDPVQVTFVGPRKQVDRLREALRRRLVLRVGPTEELHAFSQRDLEQVAADVTVEKFAPSAVRIVQEELEVKDLPNLADYILVSQLEGEADVKKEILDPQWLSLRLRGPKSALRRVGVTIPVSMGFQRQPVEGRYSIQVNPVDDELVRRTVQIQHPESRAWVSAANPPSVPLRVTILASEQSFAHSAVRLTFRLPVVDGAFQVRLNEAGSDRIAVEFRGPKDEVQRLKQACQEADFSLGVPPPPNFDPETGGTFTFTEDILELYGFPGVRIQQHESRRQELKTAWSYSVRFIPPAEVPDGE